jgi:hypothetical protein
MPETPDFDQIALDLYNDGDGCNLPYIAEQLRFVWNARGAADLDAIDSAVAYTKDGIVTGARHQIARAIRTVDR